MFMQMRATTMQRDAKNLLFYCLFHTLITLLEKITDTIIHNMSGRVESEILCIDLAITCV